LFEICIVILITARLIEKKTEKKFSVFYAAVFLAGIIKKARSGRFLLSEFAGYFFTVL